MADGRHTLCTLQCVCPHDDVYLPQISSPSIRYWLWCQHTLNIAVNFRFPSKFRKPAVLPLDPHFNKTLVFRFNLTRVVVRAGRSDRNVCLIIM